MSAVWWGFWYGMAIVVMHPWAVLAVGAALWLIGALLCDIARRHS